MASKSNSHHYVLIMAGGSGTRLYPRSTESLPKQFQKIIGSKTLIEQAYDRALRIVGNDRIYISSNHKYVELIKKYLPDIKPENYITEPVKKNTGPAIALATAIISNRDPKAIIIATHSDHLVSKEEEYVRVIKTGVNVVEETPKYILCVGITPTSPHTGLGYIEKSVKFISKNNLIVYKTKRFVEKPNLEKSKEYVASGDFFWNAGYFIWQSKNFLGELKKFNPKLYAGVLKIAKSQNSKNFRSVLDKEFVKFEDIAVDHMIMEKTKNLLVLSADIGWSDIGSWDVVADMMNNKAKDLDGNYIEGSSVNIDTHNTTILSHDKKLIIATIGLDNFIVVTTEDAIVIVPRGRSEEIKKIVTELNNQNDK